MILGLNKLLHLPVFTKSGMRLGKIIGADFDTESQSCLKYEVSAGAFSANKFIIHRSQVLEIDGTRMTVEDAVLGKEAAGADKQAVPQTALGTVTQSTAGRQ